MTERIQAKKRIQEAAENEPFKSVTKKGYNLSLMSQDSNRHAVYHIKENLLSHSAGRENLQSSGWIREARSFSQPSSRWSEPEQGEKVVIQRQVHASFLNVSYQRALRKAQVGAWQAPFRRQFVRRNGRQPEDSEILREALRRAGVPDSNDYDSTCVYGINWRIRNQAHHIVEAHDDSAQEARNILVNAGIDINSAANGVFLPVMETDNTGNAAVHLGSHIGDYAECVNRALRAAVGRTVPKTTLYQRRVLRRLAQIRDVLLNSNGALNRSGDADYDPKTKRAMTIADVFRRSRLFRRLGYLDE